MSAPTLGVALGSADLAGLFLHFLLLSLLAIGGAIATAPEMHRYLVVQQGWLSDTQFSGSIALAQAAPGPNLLFVAVLGWNTAGWAGMLACMAGILLPSTALVMLASRWGGAYRRATGLRAFRAGMAPLTLGLIAATGWLLALPFVRADAHRASTLVLIGLTVWLTLNTRIGLVWLVLGGGVLGALGWV